MLEQVEAIMQDLGLQNKAAVGQPYLLYVVPRAGDFLSLNVTYRTEERVLCFEARPSVKCRKEERQAVLEEVDQMNRVLQVGRLELEEVPTGSRLLATASARVSRKPTEKLVGMLLRETVEAVAAAKYAVTPVAKKVVVGGGKPGVAEKIIAAKEGKVMTKNEKSRMYEEFLREEGYLPKVEESGSVLFKKEGSTYVMELNDDDEVYFRILFPSFWSIDDEAERIRATAACMEVTAKVKVAKVFVHEDSVWAAIEVFFAEPAQFKPVFNRMMNALNAGVKAFCKQMRGEDSKAA